VPDPHALTLSQKGSPPYEPIPRRETQLAELVLTSEKYFYNRTLRLSFAPSSRINIMGWAERYNSRNLPPLFCWSASAPFRPMATPTPTAAPLSLQKFAAAHARAAPARALLFPPAMCSDATPTGPARANRLSRARNLPVPRTAPRGRVPPIRERATASNAPDGSPHVCALGIFSDSGCREPSLEHMMGVPR